jgi:hypothetical protein
MPRSGPIRILSIAALLLAGSLEPAWLLGHAVLHLESAHDEHHAEESGRHSEPSVPAVAATDAQTDHGHPVFQAPIRPGNDLVFSVAALPAESRDPSMASLIVAVAFFIAVPARASPLPPSASRPRAPPLA